MNQAIYGLGLAVLFLAGSCSDEPADTKQTVKNKQPVKEQGSYQMGQEDHWPPTDTNDYGLYHMETQNDWEMPNDSQTRGHFDRERFDTSKIKKVSVSSFYLDQDEVVCNGDSGHE